MGSFEMISNDHAASAMKDDDSKIKAFFVGIGRSTRDWTGSLVHQTIEAMQKVGSYRDGILMTIGIVYGVGFLMWALHANQNNLGNPPLFQSQYLGIVPVAIILGAYWLHRGIVGLNERFADWFANPEASRFSRYFRRLVFLTWALSLLLMILISALAEENQKSRPPLDVADAIITTAFAVSTLIIIGSIKLSEDLSLRIILWWAAGVIVFWAIAIFVLKAYPRIPWEFGGAQPRCAYLDLSTGGVAPETLLALVAREGMDPGLPTVRSVRVDVYYSGTNYLLVRPGDQDLSTDRSIFEVNRSSIGSILWCDQSGGR